MIKEGGILRKLRQKKIPIARVPMRSFDVEGSVPHSVHGAVEHTVPTQLSLVI